MADILLTHCNHLYHDSKQVAKMQPYPPLQTIGVAAFLRQAGFEVALFDATFDPPEEGFRLAMKRFKPRVVAVCEDNFNFLSKMCLKHNRELAFTMAGIGKEQGAPLLINSSDAYDRPAEYLSRGFDFVIVGEVESTLTDAVGRLLSRRCVEGTPGLVTVDAATGSLRFSAPRAPLRELDQLPMNAWDLIDVERYRTAWSRAHGFFSLNMVASRGCPYHCNWCAKPIYGQTYRQRPASQVAEEMRHLKNSFDPDHIWFADDIFALAPQWAGLLAEAVESLDARIPFKMQSRCDLMTDGTVTSLRRAGCSEVWMGVESGSQRILDAMEKGLRVEQVYLARENLRRHDIRACFFLQFGYPGETWEDIEETIHLVDETVPDDIGVSVSYPLPGTKFHSRVVAEMGSKRNWVESGDLSMMFRGAYTGEFYAALHDALHLEVDFLNGRSGDQRGLRHLWKRVRDEMKSAPQRQPQWTASLH